MKRKNMFAALACSLCLAVAGAAPAVVTADEAETDAVAEAAGEESGSGSEEETGLEAETGAEEGTDAETETDAGEMTAAEQAADGGTETEVPKRPDYTASDYVTLGDYKGLTVTREPVEVTEEEVDEEIQFDLQNSDQLVTLTEGVVQDGDVANIDYEGKKDGVAFDGGTDRGFDLVIGSGSFIDGFEDGLIGVAVGDTVDLPLTFPENYGVEDLDGQEVVFTVTVNEIRRAPELTDEVASALTDGEYPDVASYRESIRTELQENMDQQQEYNLMGSLLTQVANTCEITGYPQEMIDYNVALLDASYREAAEMYSMEFEDFLSTYLEMTPEDFQNEAVQASQEMMQQELYLKAIAEAEGIELTEEEYAAGTARYAEQYGYETAEEFTAANDEGEIRISLLQEKVMDFLMENANIVDAEPETEGMTEMEITAAESAPEEEESGTEAES